jgi:segregation and condensation protein A
MAYALALDVYQGPLDKLLELIEAEKLPITQVSLAKVTGGFLAHVEELQKLHEAGWSVDPQLIADFLVVASKLILIKSKALMPSFEVAEEEESELRDLEARVRLYQELKGAREHLKRAWSSTPLMRSREFLQSTEVAFFPPSSVTPAVLAEALQELLGEVERLMKPTASLKIEFANLKAKIEEVLAKVTESASKKFSDLPATGVRGELIALFLAVLHLVKEQLIAVEQESSFGDMAIARVPPLPIQ